MTVVAWILQGVLALSFLGAGVMNMALDRKRLVDRGMGWAEDYPATTVKAIGALQVLGALGVVLPTLTGIAPVLTPIAAIGCALLMVGAAVVHVRRGELGGAAPAAVFAVLAVVVAVLRIAAPG